MITYIDNTHNEPFKDAVERVKLLTRKPEDKELLILYCLYKQALHGNNISPKPGLFNIKERSKWYAWEDNKLMTRDTAHQKYIEFVKFLVDKYGLQEPKTLSNSNSAALVKDII